MTDKEYFADHSRESNSTLGWLNVSPMYYKKQLELANREDKEPEPSYFKFGHAVHTKLLENAEFDKRYVVLDIKPPSNAVQKKFCDFVIASEELDDDTLKVAYKMSYAVTKLKPETILEKAKKLFESNKEYISVTRNKDDRATLSSFEYNSINTIEKHCKENKNINDLLFKLCKNCKEFNELIIFYDFNGIKMKSKLDRLVIDFDNKIIKLIDVKTHSVKSEDSIFEESFKKAFEYRRYNRQFGLYSWAIPTFFNEKYPDIDINEFEFESYVIAIKSNFDNDVEAFKIKEEIMLDGLKEAKSLTEALKYYRENGFTKKDNKIKPLF